jgi:hypothetical protein
MTTSVQSFDAISMESAPTMPKSPNTGVELIRGIKIGSDWVTNAIVREMTGEDEEFLSSMEARTTSNYGEYVLALLKRVVVSIGDISIKQTPVVLNELIIGDRDLLFLAVIRATYGETREFKVLCPHCNQSNDLLIDLNSDFPIEGDQESVRKQIKVILRDGSTLNLNHPNSDDSAKIGRSGKNTAQQNTMMIARCAQIDVTNKEQWARNLSIADRSTIISAVFNAKVGPSPREVNAPCGHCNEEITLMFDWVSLLFG